MSDQYTVCATPRLKEVLTAAANCAEDDGEDRVSVWHLMEALLKNRSVGVASVLMQAGIDQVDARRNLDEYLQRQKKPAIEELVAAVERLTQRIREDLRKGKPTDAVESEVDA